MIFAMHFIGVFRDTKIWCILLMFFWICNRVSSNDIKLPKFISFCCVIYDFSVIILNKCRFNTSNSKVITVNVICDSAEKYPPKLLNPYLSFLVNSTLVNLKKQIFSDCPKIIHKCKLLLSVIYIILDRTGSTLPLLSF